MTPSAEHGADAMIDTDPTSPTGGAPGWRAALSTAEIQDLLRVRAWRAWVSVALNWGVIFAAFALVAAGRTR
jgi:hypothetical protein